MFLFILYVYSFFLNDNVLHFHRYVNKLLLVWRWHCSVVINLEKEVNMNTSLWMRIVRIKIKRVGSSFKTFYCQSKWFFYFELVLMMSGRAPFVCLAVSLLFFLSDFLYLFFLLVGRALIALERKVWFMIIIVVDIIIIYAILIIIIFIVMIIISFIICMVSSSYFSHVSLIMKSKDISFFPTFPSSLCVWRRSLLYVTRMQGIKLRKGFNIM